MSEEYWSTEYQIVPYAKSVHDSLGKSKYVVECQHLESSTRKSCGRTQTVESQERPSGLNEEALGAVGWAQTETGWLCPYHSDKGTAPLMSILRKTRR